MNKILEQFIEVAKLKNVSNAAKKMHLSQPTLTQNMKKLEEKLGVPLFKRTSTGVTTTEYGDLLLEQAQMMQRIYSNTLTRIKSVKEKEQHNLRIGSGHAWWNTFVRDCFNLYSSRYPTVNIHIDIGNHLRLIDLLLTGDIDLFIGHEIHELNPGVGIHFVPFFSVRDKMFARNDHPLCGELVTPESLLDYPYLKLTPDEKRYLKIVGDLKKNRINNISLHMTEPVIWSTNSLITAIDILNHSDAILRAYPGTMTAFFAEHNIVPLRSSHKGEVNIVGMYCLRERQDSPQIVEIQMLMKEHLRLIP